jgi:outer membrane protein assembly factor BamA
MTPNRCRLKHREFVPGPAQSPIHSQRCKASLWRSLFVSCAAVCIVAVCGAQGTPSAANQAPKTSPQTTQILSSFEGQNVTAVEIAGHPEFNSSQFTSLFVQHPGEPFSKEKVDQTVAALKATGKFNEVQLQVDPEADGVRVLMILEPALWFGIFEFPGAERFAYSRLVQVANFPPQAPYNVDDVERDRKNLLQFFQQEGYFQAEVQPETKVDTSHGLANIFFHVTLKQKARFGNIIIADAPPEEAAKLTRALQTLLARGRGVAIRPGRSYNRATLTRATSYLQNQLGKEDRLAAQVKLKGAEYHADTNRADIHLEVKDGPPVHVTVEGAHIFPWTRKALLPFYQGIGVDDESIQEGRQALISYFQAKGYFDAKVEAQSTAGANGDTIRYTISKEKKHKVTEVKLSGNAQVNADDLVPHIAVETKQFFSPGKFSDKLVRTSVKNLQAVYQSEGFSSAKITSKVDNAGGDIKVFFQVQEGPRDIVNSLQIEGADTFPQSKFAPDGLKLGAGKPYSQALVESDRANIVAEYLEAGYLTSSFRQTADVVSKQDPHHINVVYHIYEGPQVFAGDVITLGRVQTKQRLIDRDVSSIHPSTPLTETQLLTSESQLYGHTGVFDWAEVDPKRQITTQTKEDVLIKVHEAKRNQLTYGFGFEIINRGGSVPSGTVTLPGLPPVGLPSSFTSSQQTFYGPRGTIQFTRNNLRGKGETLSFTGFAGRLDQRGAAYYIDPNFMWSPWRATASFSAEKNEENPIYSSQQEVGSFQVQRELNKAKTTTLFLRYSFSQTNLTKVLLKTLVLPEDRNVRLSTLAANLTLDSRDNLLDAHKGLLRSLELDFNTTKLGSSVDFTKLNGQFAYYKTGFHKIVFANSLRVGLAQPFANSRVPISEAFFTGGGNSLRGFPLDGAGPQRSVQVCPNGATTCTTFIQVPSGGNELLLINSEARIPLPIKKGLGIVAFYDGGNVFPRIGFHDFASLYTNNIGLGLRYATPVGPVRIDIGHNLSTPISGVSSTQYFISIGQAF